MGFDHRKFEQHNNLPRASICSYREKRKDCQNPPEYEVPLRGRNHGLLYCKLHAKKLGVNDARFKIGTEIENGIS